MRLHPDNPKVFEFRGRPLVLVTATEHYGAVINRTFQFEPYLRDAAARGMTLTRLFVLFRELQSPINPYSSLKPDSPDYIAPYLRTGPGTALDGQLRFDLDQPNPEFYERLGQFLSLASDLGIIVELTLFSNPYCPEIWALHPYHPANNINGLEEISWPEFMSRRHARLFERQAAHVRAMVTATACFDNVLYEICNEPGGRAAPEMPDLDEVNAWQMDLLQRVQEADSTASDKHLISGQEAFAYALPDESERSGPDVHQLADQSFDALAFDVVNLHPLSNMIHRGRHYDLGTFMAGHLRLDHLRQYCLALYREGQPVNLDEDNAATQYKDERGWTIHRKRAWTALFCGAHYDCIDFSIVPGRESGTPASRQGLRAWLGHLARFIHGVDLVQARPMRDVVREQPAHTVASVFGVERTDYCVYLADAREWEVPGAGEVLQGSVVLDLPPGRFTMSCFSPTTGLYSPGLVIPGGKDVTVSLPEFQHDIVLRLKATSSGSV